MQMPLSKSIDVPDSGELMNTASAQDSDSPRPSARGVFEPPEGAVLTAIARHKMIVALFVVLGAIAGAAFGVTRPITYEAAATLQVGQVNPNSPGFASFTQSSSSLATAFSRAVAATQVLNEVQRKLGLPQTTAASRLSSEPIALSPAFRVIATGPTAKDAERLANVAAGGVIAFVNHSNSADPEAASLLSSYRSASLQLSRAAARVAALPLDAPATAQLTAKAERKASQIRLKAISAAYVATVASQPPRVGFVSFLAEATSATGNRSSKIQLFGFLGLLFGALLGCASAVLVERRRRGRQGPMAPVSSPPAA
jgi:uncharacterized protein involved in exopolysaccharide biosynthesis